MNGDIGNARIDLTSTRVAYIIVMHVHSTHLLDEEETHLMSGPSSTHALLVLY